MNIWVQILDEFNSGIPTDNLWKKYLKALNELTGRNVIAYYSGWLQNPGLNQIQLDITDFDMYMLMTAVNDLERDRGLDLILHTPGGSISAAEAFVAYLKGLFGNNIRAIVPQLAMSAGTMIACSCKEIILGKHSSLGPFDPRRGEISCEGLVDEFRTMQENVRENPQDMLVWKPIISQYRPTLVGECRRSIDLSRDIVKTWLTQGMFAGEDAAQTVENIVAELNSHENTKVHDRHISPDRCRELGLKIYMMEENPRLQEAILAIHYSFMMGLHLSNSRFAKVVANHEGYGMAFPVNNSTFQHQ